MKPEVTPGVPLSLECMGNPYGSLLPRNVVIYSNADEPPLTSLVTKCISPFFPFLFTFYETRLPAWRSACHVLICTAASIHLHGLILLFLLAIANVRMWQVLHSTSNPCDMSEKQRVPMLLKCVVERCRKCFCHYSWPTPILLFNHYYSY